MERTPRSSLDRAHCGLGIGSDSWMPRLGESVLHVWLLDLALDRESLALQEEMLSAGEWRKVRRFSSRQMALRFIGRRGLLRLILWYYLDYPPREIRFVYNAYGKPSLAPELSSDLQFSLSDSGEKAAIAVGLGEPMGIDIERLRRVPLGGELALYGSPRGKVARAGSPATTDFNFEFFQAWTCQEAVAKAEGVGLQMQSSQSELHGRADYAPAASGADGTLRMRGYYLHSLTLPSGYVGTLAARTRSPRIVYCSWQRVQHALNNPDAARRALPGRPRP